MAEIRNYTMNFGFGRSPVIRMASLTCMGKLACAEIHLDSAGDVPCPGH
jgi:hypothetical protein